MQAILDLMIIPNAKLSAMRILLCITTLVCIFSIASCRQNEEFSFLPDERIEFHIKLKEVKLEKKHDVVFFRFVLTIKNNAQQPVFFDPGKLQGQLNGTSLKT